MNNMVMKKESDQLFPEDTNPKLKPQDNFGSILANLVDTINNVDTIKTKR